MAQIDEVTLRQSDIDNFTDRERNTFKNRLNLNTLVAGTYQLMPTNASNIDASNKSGVTIAQNGVSNSGEDNFKGLGALDGTLGQYIPQAQNIYNSLYSKSKEQQEKEDRMNTGMMMLNFFTKMGAEASRPGATALGAASVAGADTASMYIKKVNADRARRDAEKKGVVGLASQLMTSADTKALALAKAKNVKPGKPDPYKITNQSEVLKTLRELNVSLINPDTKKFWDNGDIIPLTTAQYDKFGLGTLSIFKEVSPQKPNPFEKLRLDVTNVVEKYIDNENKIDPLEATTFNSSIFRIQKDRFTEIDGEDGTKQTIVEEGLDLLSILKQSYGEEKINKLLKRMGITPTSDTPITDQINNENKNKIDPKEKEVAENGDVTEYKIVKVGNKKIRVLSSRKEKMSSALVVSLANSQQALKDLDRATRIFFPNGKYDPKISLQTSALGSNSIGDARIAHQAMKRSIEVILRLRTGAAAPAEEVTSYMNQFMPNILDGRESAEIKLNALIDFFEAVTKGINEGRRPDDKTWVRRPNSNFIKDVIKDGGQIGDRKIKIIKNVPHIQKEKGSDIYLQIK